MKELLEQYEALIQDEINITAILSNTSAFIWQTMKNLNWAGFYLFSDGQLVLGPFQGKIACYRIDLNRGVCGYAATNKKSIIVDNVHEFAGHIACDAASNSELVVPIIKNDNLFGVIDLDSFKYNNFTLQDLSYIEEIAKLLAKKI